MAMTRQQLWHFHDGDRFVIRDATGELVAAGLIHRFHGNTNGPCHLETVVDEHYVLERFDGTTGERLRLVPVIEDDSAA